MLLSVDIVLTNAAHAFSTRWKSFLLGWQSLELITLNHILAFHWSCFTGTHSFTSFVVKVMIQLPLVKKIGLDLVFFCRNFLRWNPEESRDWLPSTFLAKWEVWLLFFPHVFLAPAEGSLQGNQWGSWCSNSSKSWESLIYWNNVRQWE